MNRSEFWQWVYKRKAFDNPRGNLIRDTRDLMNAGVDPDTRLHRLSSNPEAARQYRKLLKDYQQVKEMEWISSALDEVGVPD